jgi:glycosyltransferase involved in cell wall biosynthesis
MRYLLVNKYLYPRGGAETYVMELGNALKQAGNEVAYFGMYDEKNVMLNRSGLYVSPTDFHKKSLAALTYPSRVIYSKEAHDKMVQLIHDFRPDIIHLNNFNYQLTPSIIDAAKEEHVPVIMTAHDSQFVCPNHLLYNPNTDTICTKCVDSHDPRWCEITHCIHGSLPKSIIGTAEAEFYRRHDSYSWISAIICPSRFMKGMYDTDPRFANKTVYLQNFVKKIPYTPCPHDDTILYFGRISPEKGINNIIAAAKALPEIPFICAGSGPDEARLADIPNIYFVGFRSGEDLHALIRNAQLVILPSTCYENCPLSVIEAQMLGAAVIAPGYGGAAELIDSADQIRDTSPEALIDQIKRTYYDDVRLADMRRESLKRASEYLDVSSYAEKVEALAEKVIADR